MDTVTREKKKAGKGRGFKRQAAKNRQRARRHGWKPWMALAPRMKGGHDKSRSKNAGKPPTYSDKPARR